MTESKATKLALLVYGSAAFGYGLLLGFIWWGN